MFWGFGWGLLNWGFCLEEYLEVDEMERKVVRGLYEFGREKKLRKCGYYVM